MAGITWESLRREAGSSRSVRRAGIAPGAALASWILLLFDAEPLPLPSSSGRGEQGLGTPPAAKKSRENSSRCKIPGFCRLFSTPGRSPGGKVSLRGRAGAALAPSAAFPACGDSQLQPRSLPRFSLSVSAGISVVRPGNSLFKSDFYTSLPLSRGAGCRERSGLSVGASLGIPEVEKCHSGSVKMQVWRLKNSWSSRS